METALQLANPFTGWKTDANQTALLHGFHEWLNEYGLHSREEKQIIEQVNGWLLRYGSRFIEIPVNPNQKEPNDTAGYRLLLTEKNNREKFYIFPQVYLNDVIKGFNEKQANDVLFNAGMLERSKESPPRYKIKTPKSIDHKQTRCYVLLPVVEESEEEETE